MEEKFKIKFWKEPYNSEAAFSFDIDAYLTTAIASKTIVESTENYHIVLTDIGLNSLFGEFDIVKQNGLWELSDGDSVELKFLKWSIISSLDYFLK